MKILIATLVIISANLILVENASAGIEQDITKCKQMKKDQGRLACYDALAVHYLSILNSEDESLLIDQDAVATQETVSSQSINTIKAAPAAIPVAEISPNKPLTKVEAEAKVVAETEDFGQSSKNKIQTIQSAMIGEFSSWKKGMKLHLENGQVWLVKSNKSGYKRMTNPVITITRGFFGSFDAKVEGLNASTKVKRIK